MTDRLHGRELFVHLAMMVTIYIILPVAVVWGAVTLIRNLF